MIRLAQALLSCLAILIGVGGCASPETKVAVPQQAAASEVRMRAPADAVAKRFGNTEFHLLDYGICFFPRQQQARVEAYYFDMLWARAPTGSDQFAHSGAVPSLAETRIPANIVGKIRRLAELQRNAHCDGVGLDSIPEYGKLSHDIYLLMTHLGFIADPLVKPERLHPDPRLAEHWIDGMAPADHPETVIIVISVGANDGVHEGETFVPWRLSPRQDSSDESHQ